MIQIRMRLNQVYSTGKNRHCHTEFKVIDNLGTGHNVPNIILICADATGYVWLLCESTCEHKKQIKIQYCGICSCSDKIGSDAEIRIIFGTVEPC